MQMTFTLCDSGLSSRLHPLVALLAAYGTSQHGNPATATHTALDAAETIRAAIKMHYAANHRAKGNRRSEANPTDADPRHEIGRHIRRLIVDDTARAIYQAIADTGIELNIQVTACYGDADQPHWIEVTVDDGQPAD